MWIRYTIFEFPSKCYSLSPFISYKVLDLKIFTSKLHKCQVFKEPRDFIRFLYSLMEKWSFYILNRLLLTSYQRIQDRALQHYHNNTAEWHVLEGPVWLLTPILKGPGYWKKKQCDVKTVWHVIIPWTYKF